MINSITRMAVLVMAFGFIFSCSQTSHLDKAETLQAENKLNEALRSANQATRQQPENAQAHLLKAEIIAELSKNHQPADRKNLYRDLFTAADKAIEFGDDQIRDRALNVLNERADSEDRAAQNILTSSEYSDGENTGVAIAHLENARIIKPAESRYYDTLFDLYYELGNTEEAVSTLSYMRAAGLASDRHLASLGYLLVEKKRYEEAIPVLYESWSEGQGKINSGRGLANALLRTGRNEEAYKVLDLLSRLDAQTVESKLAFGRILTENGMRQLLSVYDASGDEERHETYTEAMEILNAADREFDAAHVLEQDHSLTNLTYGLYHRNLALKLTDIYLDFPELNTNGERAVQDHFYRSLSFLELVAEQQPNHTAVWRALTDVYTALEMDEQAEDARSRAEQL